MIRVYLNELVLSSEERNYAVVSAGVEFRGVQLSHAYGTDGMQRKLLCRAL